MNNIITVALDDTVNKSAIVRKMIQGNFEGKIFRAVNVKADGSIREYRALLNVKKTRKRCWFNDCTQRKPDDYL